LALLLQEFNHEIKDKKGVENSVADHLSHMNIVNFTVSGYVPPGKNKTKLVYERR
jgi:hypothetical protein